MEAFKDAMDAFQHLRSSGMVTDDMEKRVTDGKYLDAMVVEAERTADASPGFEHVQMVDGTERAGLVFHHASSGDPDGDEMTRALAASLGSGASFGDGDGDGDLDLYLVNWGPNALYRNNGDGTFTDVTEDAGLNGEPRRSMSAVFFDVDGNRAPDLYVVNDDGPNLLYCNNMDRTFQEVGEIAGVTDPVRRRGASIGDYNADGHTDLFVTAWPGEPNVLYRNRGDGSWIPQA